ncbi:MAG: DUF4097 domain-containing protein [Actinomycetota bacterium]|nr:DUF4097 domain-containing protein [Actinomycetota bacterium]
MPDTDDVTEFSTPAPVLLKIDTAGGQVRVDALDADHTVVRLRPSRAGDDRALDLIANSTVEQRGDRVLVEVPPAGVGFLRSSPDIDITVSLPTGSRLELAAKSADLRTSGLLDAVHVQIGSGDVWLDHVGEAHVQSGSGDTMLAVADRSVRVETGSGDVHLQHVTGALQVSTGSGDALVDDVCADVTIHTASGDHRVGRVRRGTVAMDSASGDRAGHGRRGHTGLVGRHQPERQRALGARRQRAARRRGRRRRAAHQHRIRRHLARARLT